MPVEHFKRYTTTGMSVDQGKTGNLNAFIVLGALTGRQTGEVGTTTFRPPYSPVTLGAIAGRNTGEFYAPRRYLPAHPVHEQLNARIEDYGWQRPDYYPQQGESAEEAIRREVLAVRSHVGVFDNSPIGKLEVRGPDAAEFLHRLYINNVLSLAPGRARYGLMLNENGVIIDDGVFTRLSENHFLVNTTSAGVARIGALMEQWLQCEWTELKVLVDDVTTQWANFTIAGPRARDVLVDLGTDLDISAEALPHMAAATGAVAGLDATGHSRQLQRRTQFRGEYSGRTGFTFPQHRARCRHGLWHHTLWYRGLNGAADGKRLPARRFGYGRFKHAGRRRLGTRGAQQNRRLHRHGDPCSGRATWNPVASNSSDSSRWMKDGQSALAGTCWAAPTGDPRRKQKDGSPRPA